MSRGLKRASLVCLVALAAGCQATPSLSPSRGPTVLPTGVSVSSAEPTPSGPSDAPIVTADGLVSVRPLSDGSGYEVVLDVAGSSTILARIEEALAGSSASFGSIHTISCPPATEFRQQYYIVGQETSLRGAISLEGLDLIGAQQVGSLYLVAVGGVPAADVSWRVLVGTDVSGGGIGSNFLDLATQGKRADSGCYADA
jgi:hypothetical protein